MLVGYARTSTVDQIAGLEGQVEALRAMGCDKIFSEQVSSTAERGNLALAMDFVREGDDLVVVRLDRLARSTVDLLSMLTSLQERSVGLRVLDFGGQEMDTKSPSGKLMLTMFGALAQFERELMLVRQREGIERARKAGRYKGRAPTALRKLDQIRSLASEGLKAMEIASLVGCSRSSVYRLLKLKNSK